MTKVEHALSHAKRGFRVFPVRENAKAPPLLTDWPNKAASDPELIKSYWLAVPNANVAIECSGMIVIDVDVAKGGDESLAALELKYGLPDTLIARTPTGGRHIFFNHPFPVGNTVGVLGRGLDIRSQGGYVLGAGSVVAAGTYTWDRDVPIEDAPAWLVDRLGTFTKREQPEQPNTPDAPALLLENAREWLASQLPAIEGCGGDAHTFKTVAGLRDMGVSAEQAEALLVSWNSLCSPPWTPEELGIKVRNAYNYGQNAPGSRVALPDDFPIMPKLGTIVPKLGTSAALRLSEFANSASKSPGYLVKGLLQRKTYTELFGAPGEGKTFVALDVAYHIAAGKPWMDRKVHAGLVLYLAYEGTGGLVKRAQALRQHYGATDVPLYITGAAYSLREPSGRAGLGQLLSTLPEKPVLIVIDTFARALMGGDENSAQDVGAFNSAIAALIESTGACVLIVHHSGKNKAAGARGSSALLGAIDTELEVDNMAVIAKKQRDIELTPPVGFKLVPLVVGVDEDGDELTSCVVEPGAAVSEQGPQGRLTGNQKRGFDVLCELAPDNSPVAEYVWREACLAFLGNKSVSQRFFDMKSALRKKGFIEVGADGNITRGMK